MRKYQTQGLGVFGGGGRVRRGAWDSGFWRWVRGTWGSWSLEHLEGSGVWEA